MTATNKIEAPDPPAPNTKADLQQRLDASLAMNATLIARVAELESPKPMVRLKPAAYACGMRYESARTWCVACHVIARQDGAQWVVLLSSLQARALRFGYAPRPEYLAKLQAGPG
jgi:hypothetical protein